ncbi:MAG TPA: hypothetical protein VK638_48500 [Edaphobacter sp.]|nr:hypothetical protein [Edaphobacter sp.]
MNRTGTSCSFEAQLCRVGLLLSDSALWVGWSYCFGQDKSGFPDGYDAVQVAPNSPRVLFENAFVMVLEVTVVPGTKEPIYHHRWPSLFLYSDTGGRTAHLRYYRADGSVHDNPSKQTPISKGKWIVKWMEPESMHSIESAETAESALTLPKRPPTVRVEFKVHP